MRRTRLLVVWIFMLTMFFVAAADAQSSRKSVSGAEVTGTFRHHFTGKFRANSNDIMIQALGKGKLRVGFELMYPYMNGKEFMANTGTGGGEADIKGDTAVFTSSEFGPCTITIKFVKPGTIDVTQEGGACGFGFNVTADGRYTKVSSKKPKFTEE